MNEHEKMKIDWEDVKRVGDPSVGPSEPGRGLPPSDPASKGSVEIGWDDVRAVGASPPVGPSGPGPGLPPSPPPTKAPLWLWLLGGAGVLLLILIGVAVAPGGGSDGKAQGPVVEIRVDVESWVARERPTWAGEISNSPTAKKTIEGIHPLVTYKRAIISEMHATTIDGSNNAGRQGENISVVEILVTFYWEGPVTKDGFTEVRFYYDYQGKQLKGQRFERSNATINLAAVDWFKVGVVLGGLLF